MALPGLFNVYNSMAAAVCCLSMGVDPVHVKAGLEDMHAVPGRIELLKRKRRTGLFWIMPTRRTAW